MIYDKQVDAVFAELSAEFNIPLSDLESYANRVKFHGRVERSLASQLKSSESKLLNATIDNKILKNRCKTIEALEDQLTQQSFEMRLLKGQCAGFENTEVNALQCEVRIRLMKRDLEQAEKRVESLQSFVFNEVAWRMPLRDVVWNLHTAKRVLILGEEDFSFTRAIFRFLGWPGRVVTTAFDEAHDISAVEGVFPVYAGVDATRLKETLPRNCGRFDRIFFMFPWPETYGHREVIGELRALLCAFLANVKDKLSEEGGMVVVALYSHAQTQGVEMERLAFDFGFSRCEKLPFHRVWDVLRPAGYLPWIPGANEEAIRRRSTLFHLHL